MTDAIPPQVFRRILEFLAAGKTGTVALQVNQGRVEAFSLTEHRRVLKDEEGASAT